MSDTFHIELLRKAQKRLREECLHEGYGDVRSCEHCELRSETIAIILAEYGQEISNQFHDILDYLDANVEEGMAEVNNLGIPPKETEA